MKKLWTVLFCVSLALVILNSCSNLNSIYSPDGIDEEQPLSFEKETSEPDETAEEFEFELDYFLSSHEAFQDNVEGFIRFSHAYLCGYSGDDLENAVNILVNKSPIDILYAICVTYGIETALENEFEKNERGESLIPREMVETNILKLYNIEQTEFEQINYAEFLVRKDNADYLLAPAEFDYTPSECEIELLMDTLTCDNYEHENNIIKIDISFHNPETHQEICRLKYEFSPSYEDFSKITENRNLSFGVTFYKLMSISRVS